MGLIRLPLIGTPSGGWHPSLVPLLAPQQMIAARTPRGRRTHAVLYRNDGMVAVCARPEPTGARGGWKPVDRPVDCAGCLRRMSR